MFTSELYVNNALCLEIDLIKKHEQKLITEWNRDEQEQSLYFVQSSRKHCTANQKVDNGETNTIVCVI